MLTSRHRQALVDDPGAHGVADPRSTLRRTWARMKLSLRTRHRAGKPMPRWRKAPRGRRAPGPETAPRRSLRWTLCETRMALPDFVTRCFAQRSGAFRGSVPPRTARQPELVRISARTHASWQVSCMLTFSSLGSQQVTSANLRDVKAKPTRSMATVRCVRRVGLCQVGDLEYGEPVVSVQLTVNSRPASGSLAVVSVFAVPIAQVRSVSLLSPHAVPKAAMTGQDPQSHTERQGAGSVTAMYMQAATKSGLCTQAPMSAQAGHTA